MPAEPKRRTAETMTREEMVVELFRAIDRDNSGEVELSELTVLAKGMSAGEKLAEAQGALAALDTDGDKKVSLVEWCEAMVAVTAGVPDEAFIDAFYQIMKDAGKGAKGAHYQPAGNREYLEATVMPTLRQGIEELLTTMEEDALALAAGKDWEGGEYMPDAWQPLDPVKWLGDFVAYRRPVAIQQREEEAAAAEAARPKAFHELSREAKLKMAFDHLDRDGSGTLDTHELLALVGKLNPGCDADAAREQLAMFDEDGSGSVELQEYTDVMMKMLEMLTDEEFDANVKDVLASTHMAFFTREEKIEMLFHRLDDDGSGTLDLDEMMTLVRAMDPNATERKAKRTLKMLDADGDAEVTLEEFKEAMGKMTEGLSDEQFDKGMGKVMATDLKEAGKIDHAAGLAPKFRSYVVSLETHETTEQIGPEALKRQKEAPFFVDVRSAEEQEVSAITGALKVVVSYDAESGENDIEAVLEKADLSGVPTDPNTPVVAYDHAGLRSAPW